MQPAEPEQMHHSDPAPGPWTAEGVLSEVYFASGDGTSPLERLYCTSQVKLTLLSPPSLQTRAGQHQHQVDPGTVVVSWAE